MGITLSGVATARPVAGEDLMVKAAAAISRRDYNAAIKLFERAISKAEAAHQASGPDYEMELQNLAACYGAVHQFAKAEATYQKIIHVEEKRGSTNPSTTYALAQLYFDEHKYAQAEPLFARSINRFEKQFGTQSLMYQRYAKVWADCLRKLKRNKEAAAVEAHAGIR